MPAAIGWKPSPTAITAICRSWSPLGGVGLALALLGLVVEPLRRFWPLEPARTGFKALLFALFVFVLLHNFLEIGFPGKRRQPSGSPFW